MQWIKRVVITVVIVFVVLAFAIPAINGDGSRWLARRWIKRFADVDSPSEALEKYRVGHREFADGSWIVATALASHGNPFGGTVVTKDSTGRTRVFFGHVCTGLRVNRPLQDPQISSLDEVFSNLTAYGVLKEQELE